MDFPVVVHGGGGPEAVVARNISTGGVFLATAQPRQVGERLALTFSLPGIARPVSVNAEVRWKREPNSAHTNRLAGAGVQFVDLSATALLAIHVFVLARE